MTKTLSPCPRCHEAGTIATTDLDGRPVDEACVLCGQSGYVEVEG